MLLLAYSQSKLITKPNRATVIARCRHGIVIRKRLLVDDEYPVYIPVVSIVRRSYNTPPRHLLVYIAAPRNSPSVNLWTLVKTPFTRFGPPDLEIAAPPPPVDVALAKQQHLKAISEEARSPHNSSLTQLAFHQRTLSHVVALIEEPPLKMTGPSPITVP